MTNSKVADLPLTISAQPKFRMRWVLAHEPVFLFEPSAREFARLVDEGTRGEVRIDIMSMADYAPGRAAADMADEVASGEDLIDAVRSAA